MGIFGWGKDETREASDRAARQVQEAARTGNAGSALERARLADEEGLSGAATRFLERLLDVGIDGKGPFASARSVADQALKDAGGDPEEAIRIVERSHRRLGAAGGFVTGLGGFFTMPVALPANVLEFYLLGTRMTAATARLRGYDIDQPQIRSAVLLTLAGADTEDLLKKAGVFAAGGRLTSVALERLPAPALMVLNKAIAFRLLGRLGSGVIAKLGRAVPVVGGLVGGGVDLYLLGRIAKQATEEFPRQGATGTPDVRMNGGPRSGGAAAGGR
ncbi:EcsC family protein [Intrasporangium sp. DVR]|uniref:EcsC family protein n=1 Tax=Intrasporangium sp. DVR TaxID=3127867 RepID=UPI00313A64F8